MSTSPSINPPAPGELIDAAREGAVMKIISLLERGADIEEKDADLDTPLNEAARKGHEEAVRLLIQKGARLTSPNRNGKTALAWAKSNMHVKAFQILEDALKAQSTPKPKDEWLLMGTDKVAHISVYPKTGKRLTDIFNFSNRERVVISDDLDTKASAMTPITSFDDLSADIYTRAFKEFTKLGGKADEDFVLRGVKRIEKSRALG